MTFLRERSGWKDEPCALRLSVAASSIQAFPLELASAVFPAAISSTLLGAIESLLSAVVADGMPAGGIAPVANWSHRGLPTSDPPCSAVFGRPRCSSSRPLQTHERFYRPKMQFTAAQYEN